MGYVTDVHKRRRRRRSTRWLIFLAVMGVVGVDAYHIVQMWPDWGKLKAGVLPVPAVVRKYNTKNRVRGGKAKWRRSASAVASPILRRAMQSAADPRFGRHPGVDWRAVQSAVMKRSRVVPGAPSIAERAAGGLLVGGNGLLERWHAVVLGLAMTRFLPKERIMDIFLSTAELGPGVYGVAAAADHYWNKTAKTLTPEQSIALAATLASPRAHNPGTKTPQMQARVEAIRAALGMPAKTPAKPAKPAKAPARGRRRPRR